MGVLIIKNVSELIAHVLRNRPGENITREILMFEYCRWFSVVTVSKQNSSHKQSINIIRRQDSDVSKRKAKDTVKRQMASRWSKRMSLLVNHIQMRQPFHHVHQLMLLWLFFALLTQELSLSLSSWIVLINPIQFLDDKKLDRLIYRYSFFWNVNYRKCSRRVSSDIDWTVWLGWVLNWNSAFVLNDLI